MAGLFGKITRGLESKATDISAVTWARLFGDAMTAKSGVTVSRDSALRVATVLACMRVISEGCAQLPFKLYREGEDGSRKPAKDHPLYEVLYRRPNGWMTSFEFRETLTMHAVIANGGLALKNYMRPGVVGELLPIMPGNWRMEQDSNFDVKVHIDIGGGSVLTVPRDSVLFVRGPSWDGVCGLDIVQQAREAIGLAIATEESHARLFSNGAQPGGILSTESTLDDKVRERIKEQWQQNQATLANRFKTLVLDKGLKWTPMSMSGVDSQHDQTRARQIEEICRAFRVLPIMIGHPADLAARAAVSSMFLAHVIHSLGPWVERWEQSVYRDVLRETKDDSLYAKMNMSAFLRGSPTERSNYFSKALGSGGSPAWMTVNEVRLLDELNPMEGHDELAVATNPATPQPNSKDPKDPADDSADDEEGNQQ
jgi:HK97 family phage portal protein